MKILDRLFARDAPDPEVIKKTHEKKLEGYRSLKHFAAKQGDPELLEFASRREQKTLGMLEDEYEVIRGGQ